MMQSLLGRWFGNAAKAPAGAAKAAVAAAPVHKTIPTEAHTSAPTVGARRALVDLRGGVVGYEFSVGASLIDRLHQRPNALAQNAHFQALLAGMRCCTQQGLLAYAELPAAWLPTVDVQSSEGIYLGLTPSAGQDVPQMLASVAPAWRAAGARLGWQDQPEHVGMGLLPDFSLSPSACRPDFSSPHVAKQPWVAPHLPDLDELDAALVAGALWAGCATPMGAEPRQAKALPAQTQGLMQLLNRLLRDDDTDQVVQDIKRDAALCARLLQHLNSAGVSGRRGLDSIEQAVAVLGRNALYLWVAALLVRQSPARPAAGALQALALARARLMESLARAAAEASPGSLYVVGLASVLPQLMQASLADVLAGLGLPPQAEMALRARSGPWGRYLDLAEALEAPDLASVQRLSHSVGGLEATMALSARAWLPH